MTFARIAPANPAWGGGADHRDDHRDDPRDGRSTAACEPTPLSVLSPDVVSRFHVLIEEVTDQLMQGPHQDRGTCRADAIALLIATSGHVDESPEEDAESPLMYLLLEEQRKAAAVLGGAATAGGGPAFLRA